MIAQVILQILTNYCHINNSNGRLFMADKYPVMDSLNRIATPGNVESIEHSNNSFYICICVISTLVAIIYFYYKKEQQKKIESILNDIAIHISKKQIVTASRKLDSIQKEIGNNSMYTKRIKESEDLVNQTTIELDSEVFNLVKQAKDKIVKNGDTRIYDGHIAKILSDSEIPHRHKQWLNNSIHKIEEEYKKGIIPEQELVYTNYTLKTKQDIYGYCYYTAPKKRTIVYPYRRQKVELRGYTEADFEQQLRLSLKNNDNYQVLGDVSILVADNTHPYEPDISIIELNNKYGIRIDIEIDEPYGGLDKCPIHYIGCGDDFRDKYLSHLGWLVVRFSEKQIYTEPELCINYIHTLIKKIDPDFKTNRSDEHPMQDGRWTEVDAKKMIARRYRENLLNHEFGAKEHDLSKRKLSQTELEKQAARKIKPFDIPSSEQKNIDHSTITFLQDAKLQFEPQEHIYLYDGKIHLMPISNIVNLFFAPFDAIGISQQIALRDNIDQCAILEEWECKGAESREIGTFMHSQIESYFQNSRPIYNTQFVYNGDFVNVDKEVSIEMELQFFKNFIRDHDSITPFRTEWRICDLELKIAGTIDLLCKNKNGGFDIYDWKRSRKASPDERIWRNGINGLHHVPDISFYHYALQQNLYKYILENNYNVRIDNMYIVVFHADFENYQKYRIPNMGKEVQIMVKYIQSHCG